MNYFSEKAYKVPYQMIDEYDWALNLVSMVMLISLKYYNSGWKHAFDILNSCSWLKLFMPAGIWHVHALSIYSISSSSYNVISPCRCHTVWHAVCESLDCFPYCNF